MTSPSMYMRIQDESFLKSRRVQGNCGTCPLAIRCYAGRLRSLSRCVVCGRFVPYPAKRVSVVTRCNAFAQAITFITCGICEPQMGGWVCFDIDTEEGRRQLREYRR